MRKSILIATAFILTSATCSAFAQGRGVAGRDAPSNFDRTHGAIDRAMQTGNDRSPPLGQGRGEQTGIGGSTNFGGGHALGSQSGQAINQRNQ